MPHKGYKQTLEHRLKRRGPRPGMLGRKRSEETKQKISLAKMGKKLSPEHCKAISEGHKGIRHSAELRKKLSNSHRRRIYGPNFMEVSKPRLTKHSTLYPKWRKSVLERDNYTCVFCGEKNGVLHADHIKPYALHPEVRYELSNGRTLCFPCHKKTDTYGTKIKALKQGN